MEIHNSLRKEVDSITAAADATTALTILRGKPSDIGEIQLRIDQADTSMEVTNTLVILLEELSRSYREISKLRDKIISDHSDPFERIRLLRDKSTDVLKSLESKNRSFQEDLVKIQKKAEAERDAATKSEFEADILKFQVVLRSIDLQKQIWKQFVDAQDHLFSFLGASSRSLYLLLHVLGVNAEIYAVTSETAKFAGNLSETALLEIGQGGRVALANKTISGVTQSWETITEIAALVSPQEGLESVFSSASAKQVGDEAMGRATAITWQDVIREYIEVEKRKDEVIFTATRKLKELELRLR